MYDLIDYHFNKMASVFMCAYSVLIGDYYTESNRVIFTAIVGSLKWLSTLDLVLSIKNFTAENINV